MHPLVLLEVTRVGEILAALQAVVRPLARVDPLVPFEIARRGEVLTALKARERSLSAVDSLVALNVADSEILAAVLTVVRPLG